MSHAHAKRLRKYYLPTEKVRTATAELPGRVSRGMFMRNTVQHTSVRARTLDQSKERYITTLSKCARMVVQSSKRRGRVSITPLSSDADGDTTLGLEEDNEPAESSLQNTEGHEVL